MTNEELLSVAEIVEKLTDRFNAQAALHRERHNEYDKLIASMNDDHEAKMVEHRAAFGARTEADRKIIAGLREEVKRLQWENATMHKDAEDGYAEAIKVLGDPIALSKERDALRAEVAALQERLRASIARGDFAQMEIAALKSQTPKQHGRWVRATSEKCMHAKAGEVVSVRGYLVRTNSGEFLWEGKDCEPCDPPATHDTPEGRSVAEAVIRDGRKTDPVAEEIKVGDIIEVVSATHRIYTEHEDLGRRGIVTAVDGMRLSVEAVPGYQLPISGIVGKCDVRKVTTALTTEPVAEEIKVGDIIEVVSNTGLNTWLADVGSFGTVASVETIMDLSVRLDAIPGKKNALGGYVSLCDVRKVTT